MEAPCVHRRVDGRPSVVHTGVRSDPAFERKGVLTPAAAQVDMEDPAQGRRPGTQGRGLHRPLVLTLVPTGHMSMETEVVMGWGRGG